MSYIVTKSSISGSGGVIQLTTDDATVVTPTLGNINMAGGANISSTGAGSTATFSLTGTTDHALQIGNATGSLTSLAVAADGELIVGSTGLDPVLATLTAGTDISIVNAAGSITINSTGSSLLTFAGDSGTATPAANTINVIGGDNVTTTAAGSTVTYALTGTTDNALQVGNASGSLTSLALGTNNTALLGVTGSTPVFGTVPNATLSNSSVTLNSGNNVTVTGSPLSLGGTASVALTGTTENALQVGNASGSLTSLGVAANGQIPIGSSGSSPVPAAITAGANISIVNGPGSITISSSGGGGGFNEGFLSYAQNDADNQTGDGSTAIFRSASLTNVFNDGNAWNRSTGTFTAPSAGIYIFNGQIEFNISSGNYSSFLPYDILIEDVARSIFLRGGQGAPTNAAPNTVMATVSGILKLVPGNEVKLLLTVGRLNSGGKVIGWFGVASTAFQSSYFCGYRIG